MKQKSFKELLKVFVVFALTIALCGCAGDKEGSDSSSIIVGIPQDLEDSLDPHKVAAAGTKEVLFNIFEGLVKPSSNGEFLPAVAKSYEVSEDGKTYTFELRDDVKFHDGSLVTAEDVKYSIDRCADDGTGTCLVPAYANIKDTQILEDGKFVINLVDPDTEFLAYMTTAIIPKSNTTPDTTPIGTGPYMFVSRSPQENFIIQKFEDYYDKDNAAHINLVTFKIIGNMDTIAVELESGALDMVARIPTAQAEILSDKFDVLEGTMNLVQALYLNNNVAPFDDVRVRQALCYALDVKEVMDIVSDGKGTEIGSSMFPSFGKYYDDSLKDVYDTDIDKAKQLLAEAGYEDGFSFDITVPSNYTQHVDTAQVLVEQFKKIGVTANIKLIEWDSWLSDVYSARNYTSTVIGVDASSLTASALLQRFKSDASNNFINFSSSEYDETFSKARSTTNDEEKTRLYKECQKILTNEAANVYIQDLPELVALNKKFTGYEFYPMYIQDMAKIRLAD